MQQSSLKQWSLLPDSAPRAQVLVPYPLARAYDYRIPEGMALALGDYVSVPWGKKEIIGVVWSLAGNETLDPAKLKSVLKKYDGAAMGQTQRQSLSIISLV